MAGLEEFHRAQKEAAEQDFIRQQMDGVKKTVLQRCLTKEARERLANVKSANPQLAEKVEMAIVEAANYGQITEPLDDEKLKAILSRVTETKKGFRIIR